MSQQSNPATLREALWVQLEERARQECPKGSHEDHECETCEHCHYYMDTAWIGVEAALAASGTEAAPKVVTYELAEKIHQIIERHSTDVVDYELAADDINALFAAASPEGEGREAQCDVDGCSNDAKHELLLADYCMSVCDAHKAEAYNRTGAFASRQSAAPSGGATLSESVLAKLVQDVIVEAMCGIDGDIRLTRIKVSHLIESALAQESKTGAVTETK